MKALFVSLDTNFVHTLLAPWCLRAESQKRNTTIINTIEFTVNTEFEKILKEVYTQQPDVVAVSCYIFNYETVARLVGEIKKVLPRAVIVLGGPEVSFDPLYQLAALPAADYVVCGEGEAPFAALIAALEAGREPGNIPGVACRGPGGPVFTPPAAPPEMEALASPYTPELLEAAKGKIIYYEASRGCPFSCAYCLSSRSGGVRFLPLARVKEELALLLSSQVKQIKFVDRTFNCSPARAAEIVRFLVHQARTDKTGRAAAKNIHFEMAADLMSEELFSALADAPAGFIQLELGIQSWNEQTLAAVSRKTDLSLCARNVTRLVALGNMHIHLDLIAGLPLEDIGSFARSFEEVYALCPHVIQLGFLKLLKGCQLRAQAEPDGCIYQSHPPYEVLSTPHISFSEICFLKNVAECVERVYNSGKFARSRVFLAARFESPFLFYAALTRFLEKNGCFDRSLSLRELYERVLVFGQENLPETDTAALGELLKFDCLCSDPLGGLPPALPHLKNPALRELSARTAQSLPQGARFHLETFAFDPLAQQSARPEAERTPVVLCFDGLAADRVTGLHRVFRVE